MTKRKPSSNAPRIVGILVNDIHLDRDNLELVGSIIGQLIEACRKWETKNVFIGGDVFTNRSGQPLSCLAAWRNILLCLQDEGITAHAIPGNHDKTDPDDDRSYLDIFSDYGSMKLHRVEGWMTPMEGVIVAMMPYWGEEKWLERYGIMLRSLEREGWRDKYRTRILITHMGVDGVMNNDGSRVVSVIVPSRLEEDGWTKVLIGHYHDSSHPGGNVFYTGSAYQANYAESPLDKGFTAIREDGSLIPIPSVFPRYIKEVVAADDRVTLENIIEKYGEPPREDFIRLLFRGSREECHGIDIARLEGLGFDVKFEVNETVEAMMGSEEDVIVAHTPKTLLKSFMQFCARSGIRGEDLKTGVRIFKEAIK